MLNHPKQFSLETSLPLCAVTEKAASAIPSAEWMGPGTRQPCRVAQIKRCYEITLQITRLRATKVFIVGNQHSELPQKSVQFPEQKWNMSLTRCAPIWPCHHRILDRLSFPLGTGNHSAMPPILTLPMGQKDTIADAVRSRRYQ